MKQIVLLISTALTGCSQFSHPGANNLVIDGERTYYIENEDSLYSGFEPEGDPDTYDTLRSSLTVNDDWITIRSTQATLKGDTLHILIHELNPAFYHRFYISIFDGKYSILYKFTTGDEFVASTLESWLVLNAGDFRPGQEVRGHVEYKGECFNQGWKELFEISGTFKAIIK